MTETQPDDTGRRLLLVHAHPDDETIGTGATMARYVAEGAQVTLVTCTLGEEGEVLVPALAQLAADHADQLGGWRIAELNAAMAELGVTDRRFLGGAGRFRDSGMMGTPANSRERAFWRADTDRTVFAAALGELVAVIREVRPQVVVTYDDFGGYGHPDHIMAHRVATAAVRAAGDAAYSPFADETPARLSDSVPWRVSKLYWTAMPRSVMAEQLVAVRSAAGEVPFAAETVDDLPFVVADELVTTRLDCSDFGDAKARAMAAHATQITLDGPFFALSDNLGRRVATTEYFRLRVGELGELDQNGHETDLFAGLGLDGRAAAE
ncbi:N-acetyl-1-D-myo-inositol-2-amino-2-deoxy-alpha-D-glucopyranoside deacetylase [Jatrophihabitans lederbergiae]|uniref:1D-myo-inositol 2-acetamido-2-deoxy-alpha-D-glucopyranoside deacetylase n=1 Tax=Jatrophihabitans lederbergiae TaxID=3075547 RepID=A0ABU2JAV6_9ACTN|nr:N-acetyl-1-D-myo-inositol-2-amino-2-deoxy-alpha-D-glucopyranoside deacetylase [Jatrophihabitans sp. DSM 44399]MDT0261789.1 N-acetyl-1-D-myo-inositol-2-amino-2-deoxy-alpha-D-glucopyranoside deacetylase [Jatrophihabitans sp. DSM 44399]